MKRKTIILIIAFIISVPATYYASVSVIFYLWLNAAEPERWPVLKTTIWAGGSLIIALISICACIYSAVKLLSIINTLTNEKHNK